MAALVQADRVYETSITTGTGTYTLAGAVTGFRSFSAGVGANNLCTYFATDGTNWEAGIGTVLTGPDRLDRTAIHSSSNGGSAVNWSAGTRNIICAPLASFAQPRLLSKSVAGSSNVTLTQDEQRRQVLILTGALTGNIEVYVDTTVWEWTVYNNTSGSYTLTVKTAAGSGIAVTQGRRRRLLCDGTNVVDALSEAGTLKLPLQPAFMAYGGAAANVTGDGTVHTVVFESEVFDQNSDYAIGTGIFTAPVTGRYQLNVNVRLNQVGGAHTYGQLKIVTSNREYVFALGNFAAIYAGGGELVLSGAVLADMDAADTAYVTVTVVNGTKVVDMDTNSFFSGHLAC